MEEGIEIAGIRSDIGHRRPPFTPFNGAGVMDGGANPPSPYKKRRTAVRDPPAGARAGPLKASGTALAAKNELEKRQEVSRGPSEIFSGQRDLVNPVAQEFARCTTAILTAVSRRIFLRRGIRFPVSRS
jgi:hypothetical protein